MSLQNKNPDPYIIELHRPFTHNEGYAWLADIDIEGDGTDMSTYMSDLALFEDGKSLGPSRSAHNLIRECGLGRFSHWGKNIHFAASDNSDPNTNGRSYTAKVTTRDAAIDRATYGLSQARLLVKWLGLSASISKPAFLDLKVFELGPGPSMATAMAIASFGGTIYVKERDSVSWDNTFHGSTAKSILDLLRKGDEAFDPIPLERSLAQNAFNPEHIVIFDGDRSSTASTLANSIDHTFSMGVLEHVENISDEISFLYAISKRRSLSSHFVDFADHHNNEQPLEFLLLNDEEFIDSCAYRYSRGNRVRFHEFKQIAGSIGFCVETVDLLETDSGYLERFIPRLRKTSSRYKDAPPDWFKTQSAVINLKKI